MKRITLLSLLLSFTLSAYAQLDHIRYQLPDSLLNDQAFAQLDTSSYLTTGVLWDRAIPNLDFLAYQGYNDGDSAQGLDAFQAYAVLKERGKVLNAFELVCFSTFANIANAPLHFCENRMNGPVRLRKTHGWSQEYNVNLACIYNK